MRTNVYLTVDTEHSMGGAWASSDLRPVPTNRRIFCKINDQDHGIGWMCSELNRRKFRATFFGEVFASLVFGEDDTRHWFQFLLENGQDVQLHTHLNFYHYSRKTASLSNRSRKTDNLADLEPAVRSEMVEYACDLFRRAAGYRPVAYRAGNWRGSRALLVDLRKMGIILDSSFNKALQGRGSFDNEPLAVNSLQWIDGVWELPITVARQSLPDPAIAAGLRPFTPTSMSRWEMEKVLQNAHHSGTTHVAAVFHSFSGVKAKDKQYSQIKPNRIAQKRFIFLLDYLAAHHDKFRVSTLAELADEAGRASSAVHATVPNLGFLHPLARKIVQAINSRYW
jgi:hypothetical protein